MIVGTLAYMSPEVYKYGKNRLSAASDIWAIGCIYYELSSGRQLFETEEMYENYINTGNIGGKHAEFIRNLDPQIITILEGCLNVDPNARINVWTLLGRISPGRLQLH
jgi:serine/threonine protein kinase